MEHTSWLLRQLHAGASEGALMFFVCEVLIQEKVHIPVPAQDTPQRFGCVYVESLQHFHVEVLLGCLSQFKMLKSKVSMSAPSPHFWSKLPKPFFVLAPLANVTDAAFRRISADGLLLGNRAVLERDLLFTEGERPIVAQLFSGKPEMLERAASIAADLGFDGIDLNMGCPDKSVEKQGAGAKMITDPERAVACIEAAKRGARGLPVSVKTRLGYNKDVLDTWLPQILSAKPAAVTIHARTRKEMSAVPARWECVARAVQIRNELGSDALIIGNGDLKDLADAKEKVALSGADGAMFGRAIFGTPWLFSGLRSGEVFVPSVPERLRIAVAHAKLFETLLGDIKNFALMKKHFKAYAEGFPGAKELRMKLMETSSAKEIEDIVEDFLAKGVY